MKFVAHACGGREPNQRVSLGHIQGQKYQEMRLTTLSRALNYTKFARLLRALPHRNRIKPTDDRSQHWRPAALRFEASGVRPPRRGLCLDAQASFRVAVAGQLQFGNYFAVNTREGTVWKWELTCPIAEDCTGWTGTEEEAQTILAEAHKDMLRRLAASQNGPSEPLV